jgi:hypothetical protein
MNQEDAWANCPLAMANAALRIAREYWDVWELSKALPPRGLLWSPEDRRPTIAEIEDAIPADELRARQSSLFIERQGPIYRLAFTERPPSPSIVVAGTEDGQNLSYTVRVYRMRGQVAWGQREGDDYRCYADDTAWKACHVQVWNGAWHTLGIEPPPFPGKLQPWRFDYAGHWPEDPESLKYATVMIPPSAHLVANDLLQAIGYADRVLMVTEDGYHIQVAFDTTW